MTHPNRTHDFDLPVTTDHGRSSQHTEGPPFELFRNREGNAFVDMHVDGHRETRAVLSDTFRRWLALKLYEVTGKAPSRAELTRQVELLEAKALRPDIPERDIYIRAACENGYIYIDLADNGWSAVEIGPDGWRIIQNSPVRFIRMSGMMPLPPPEQDGSIESLRSLINVRDENDFVLLISWLLNALRNQGGHPPLVLKGGEGTAKSTLVAILRALIDPSCTPLGGLPRTERELIIQAGQRYVQPFDNIPVLTIQMSNALCRLATGVSARPVILNGIDDVVTRPDLADRCLFVTCDAISDERRRSELQVWAEFEKLRPQILGILFDAVVHGLRTMAQTTPTELPRMADFAVWGNACEAKFWQPGTFRTAYEANRADVVETLIDADPVASAVRSLIGRRGNWLGTATELDGLLRALFGKIDEWSGWPKEPRLLARRLRDLETSLMKVGIEVKRALRGHDRTRLISISATTGRPDAPTDEATFSSTQPNSPSAPSAPSGTVSESTQHDTASDTSKAAESPEKTANHSPSTCSRTSTDAADAADAKIHDKSVEFIGHRFANTVRVFRKRRRLPGRVSGRKK
jgi:hypothetical protein